MYDFMRQIDEVWPEIEVELKASPYYSEPTEKGYLDLVDELRQGIEVLNKEKDFIRVFYNRDRELKRVVMDCIETLDEEIKGEKCKINYLRNIGQRLRRTQREEGNRVNPNIQQG